MPSRPTPQAPEIYAKPLSDFPGSEAGSESVIATLSLEYASKGWNAAITVQDGIVRVLAVPQQGIEPITYLEGLCQHGFIEDALPGLEALNDMVDDARVAYNYGLALSELGRAEESLAPLNRCLSIDPSYDNAAIAIGVALSKLRRFEEAEVVLKAAAKIAPDNALIKQNLAATMANNGKLAEALPYFRQAASLAPDNPAVLMGLAQCLDSIPEQAKEATEAYKVVAKKFGGTNFGEAAKQILNRRSNENLHNVVDGGIRPDAVEYMLAAIKRFAAMDPQKVGQAVLEIARRGEQGLAINDPSVRYKLDHLDGDFSGLQLLCYMHVGLKQFDPRANTGSGLDREYEMAKRMVGK